MTHPTIRRAVLAYSGGLDTSIIVRWLRERYGCEVACYCANVGQDSFELDGLERKALASGAMAVRVDDLREEFARDYAFPALRAGAVYEGRYLLGTALARPLIAARQVAFAHELGADALAHGCTGKGNDQVRFELTYMTLAPEMAILAPWREWDIHSREDALAYAARHGIPIAQTTENLYSRDGNLWHLSCEGGELETADALATERVHQWTAAPAARPAAPEHVVVGFVEGTPVSLDGRDLSPAALLTELNARAGRHGVGRAELVESRMVGMKSRGVYETPAGTVLHEALEDLLRLTLPHDLLRTRHELGMRYADLVYAGQWISPLREALQAFADSATRVATGSVTVELFQGRATAVSRQSPHSLFDASLASFNMRGYRPQDAEGFIRLTGLPLVIAARQAAPAAQPVRQQAAQPATQPASQPAAIADGAALVGAGTSDGR